MIFRGIGLSVLLVAPLTANTGVFFGQGGRMVAIRSSEVRMVKEQVDIRLVAEPGRYGMPCMPVAEVRAEFLLQNTSTKAVNLQAGFPFALGKPGEPGFQEDLLKGLAFAVESEGTRRTAALSTGTPDPAIDPKGTFSHIYTWEEGFRAGETRRVVVTYRQMLSLGRLMTHRDVPEGAEARDLERAGDTLAGLQASFFYVTATARTWKQGPEEARFTLEDRALLEGLSRPMAGFPVKASRPVRRVVCDPVGAQQEGTRRVWTFRNGVPEQGIHLSYLRLDWPTTPEEFKAYRAYWTEQAPSYRRVKGAGAEGLAGVLAAGFRRMAGQPGEESPWVKKVLEASWMGDRMPGLGEPLDPQDRKTWLEAAKMLEAQ